MSTDDEISPREALELMRLHASGYAKGMALADELARQVDTFLGDMSPIEALHVVSTMSVHLPLVLLGELANKTHDTMLSLQVIEIIIDGLDTFLDKMREPPDDGTTQH